MNNQKYFVNITLITLAILLTGSISYLILARKSTSLSAVTKQVSSPTSAPQTTQSPSSTSTIKDIDLAKQALTTYFNLLKNKQYNVAVAYHGSGYETLQNWNPDLNPNDHTALLKNGCENNGWQCLKIKNILNERRVSQSEFEFTVQFEKPEWSTGNETIFTQGPCCGRKDTGQRKTNFKYIVKKVNGNFVIMTPPIYVA